MNRTCTRTVCRYSMAVALTVVAACSGPREPRRPEEAAARGDQLLRKLSDTLNAAPAFSFTVAEWHERLRRNGEKAPYTLTREVVVRRPDRLWSHTTGSDNRDVTVTYDGTKVTVVGAAQKVFATITAPPTLDEMLDLVSDRYDLRIAVSDFLYSSPCDSFAGSDATGAWVKRTNVEGKLCDEVAYKMKAVDFTLAISSAEPALPCAMQITYKEEPGQPVSRLVFRNWNLGLQTADSLFAANVPQGCEQIPIVERIPKTELKADAAKAMGAPAADAATVVPARQEPKK
ncbi:MAG TPA: DUF2092 domain-containing protein [Vicinamibacterales bacterium]|nr:DUF2092 domain-containing protein [Vicinamibacterales bacterium]